jgi:hypothetical protein
VTIPSIYSQTLEEREKQIAQRNKIKTKIQYDYKYTNGKPAETGSKTCATTYSSSGDILEKKYYNSKDQVIGWEKYEYDASGNRTLYERENASSKYKKVSKYGNKNDLLLESGFNGAENFRNEYTYTAANKPSEIVYNVSNKIEQKLVYEHTGNDALLKIFTGGTTLTSRVKLKYDSRGNITEETTLSIDNKELEKKTYTYTPSSLILTEEKTRQGAFNYRISYAYDTKGNLLTVMEENISQKKYTKKMFTYDASGNLTQYKWRRNATDEFNVKTYTYNAKGICLTEHTFYPKTKFELLSKFGYDYN